MTIGGHVLVVRLDNAGDVVLAGPAVRALASAHDRVTMLCGPAGAPAAALLPGVDDIEVFDAPWIDLDRQPVDEFEMYGLVSRLREREIDRAAVFTSFHQSSLPAALVLKLAGIAEVAGTSTDHPGRLLDRRRQYDPTLHEVTQQLEVAALLGAYLPADDDGRLALTALPSQRSPITDEPYVVVHPGASAPARALPRELARQVVSGLADCGWHVLVTGTSAETSVVDAVAGVDRPEVTRAAGWFDLPGLAHALAHADAVVVGNTGPAHLAAAVGCPVVSVFAPTVDPSCWHPWHVPTVLFGNHVIECAGCRARTCPLPRQLCTEAISSEAVVSGVLQLVDSRVQLVAR